MHRFITELNHFGPLFVKKKTSAKFFPKNHLSQLSLYATATSYKKNRKVPCIDFPKNLKNFILGQFRPLLVPKNHLHSILSIYTAIIPCKKSEKFHALTFDNAWKTSLWAHFGQKLLKKVFPEKFLASILSLYNAVVSCKKSQRFYPLTYNT